MTPPLPPPSPPPLGAADHRRSQKMDAAPLLDTDRGPLHHSRAVAAMDARGSYTEARGGGMKRRGGGRNARRRVAREGAGGTVMRRSPPPPECPPGWSLS